jgi:hypothetical protein
MNNEINNQPPVEKPGFETLFGQTNSHFNQFSQDETFFKLDPNSTKNQSHDSSQIPQFGVPTQFRQPNLPEKPPSKPFLDQTLNPETLIPEKGEKRVAAPSNFGTNQPKPPISKESIKSSEKKEVESTGGFFRRSLEILGGILPKSVQGDPEVEQAINSNPKDPSSLESRLQTVRNIKF